MWHVVEYIRRKRPRAYVLENVVGFRSAGQGRCYTALMHAMRDMPGYTVQDGIVNAKHQNVSWGASLPRARLVSASRSASPPSCYHQSSGPSGRGTPQGLYPVVGR